MDVIFSFVAVWSEVFWHFALKSQQVWRFVPLKHHLGPLSLQLNMTFVLPPPPSFWQGSMLFRIVYYSMLSFYMALFIWEILYTTSATFYFLCCILQNVFQIDSFFNWKRSTVHRNYFFTVRAIKMIYHLLLASHCSSCNTVNVSAFFYVG